MEPSYVFHADIHCGDLFHDEVQFDGLKRVGLICYWAQRASVYGISRIIVRRLTQIFFVVLDTVSICRN